MSFSKGFNQSSYSDVRHLIQPGDVLAFGGCNFGSRWIQLCSKSNVNHVATTIQRYTKGASSSKEYDLEIIESVFRRDGFSGVRTVLASKLLENYPGKVWWLPLGERQREKIKENIELFNDWMLRQKGKDFDFKQATQSVFDIFDSFPFLKEATYAEEDFSKFFCSELVAAGLELCGVLQKLNASEVTPIDLCMFNIYADYYVLIQDNDQEGKISEKINGFNTVNEKGWGI